MGIRKEPIFQSAPTSRILDCVNHLVKFLNELVVTAPVYDFVHVALNILYVIPVSLAEPAWHSVSVGVKLVATPIVENLVAKDAASRMPKNAINVTASNVGEKVLQFFKEGYCF